MANKLRKLLVREVSPVTRPANPGADILIVKGDGEGEWKPCDDCPDPKVCRKAGGCQAEADAAEKGMGCDPMGRPKKRKWKRMEKAAIDEAFAAVLGARETLLGKADGDDGDPVVKLATLLVQQDFAKAAAMFDDIVGVEAEREMLWRATRALNDSMHSILGDGAAKQKPKLLRQTLNQFVAYLEGEFDLEADADEADDDETEKAGGEGDGNAAPGGDAAGGSGHMAKEDGMTVKNGAPGANAEALAKAEQERAEAVAKATDLEKANKAMGERLAALEKAQAEQAISKAVDEVVGASAIDKAAVRGLVEKLGTDAASIATLKQLVGAQAAQAATASLFTTFGKTDAPPAAAAGATALAKANELAIERMKKAQGIR